MCPNLDKSNTNEQYDQWEKEFSFIPGTKTRLPVLHLLHSCSTNGPINHSPRDLKIPLFGHMASNDNFQR